MNDEEEDEDGEVSDDHKRTKRSFDEGLDNSSDAMQPRPVKCSDLPMTVLVAMYPDLGKIASLRRNPT